MYALPPPMAGSLLPLETAIARAKHKHEKPSNILTDLTCDVIGDRQHWAFNDKIHGSLNLANRPIVSMVVARS